MLKLKTIRKKNAPDFDKWEGITVKGEYVIIRYKDNWLDVRVAKSYDDFLLQGCRTIFREQLDIDSKNHMCLEGVLKYLGIEMEESDVRQSR